MCFDPELDYRRLASPVAFAPRVLEGVPLRRAPHHAANTHASSNLGVALAVLALLVLITLRLDAGFQAPLAFDVGANLVFVAVGDFNSDGIPDWAVANYSRRNVSVRLGGV
jgi:hypothetical protein